MSQSCLLVVEMVQRLCVQFPLPELHLPPECDGFPIVTVAAATKICSGYNQKVWLVPDSTSVCFLRLEGTVLVP